MDFSIIYLKYLFDDAAIMIGSSDTMYAFSVNLNKASIPMK